MLCFLICELNGVLNFGFEFEIGGGRSGGSVISEEVDGKAAYKRNRSDSLHPLFLFVDARRTLRRLSGVDDQEVKMHRCPLKAK